MADVVCLLWQYWGVTSLDVEVRDVSGAWRALQQFRANRNVKFFAAADGSPITGVRLRVLASADGQFSRIVHVDLLGP